MHVRQAKKAFTYGPAKGRVRINFARCERRLGGASHTQRSHRMRSEKGHTETSRPAQCFLDSDVSFFVAGAGGAGATDQRPRTHSSAIDSASITTRPAATAANAAREG
jgi:hypothetical protein